MLEIILCKYACLLTASEKGQNVLQRNELAANTRKITVNFMQGRIVKFSPAWRMPTLNKITQTEENTAVFKLRAPPVFGTTGAI